MAIGVCELCGKAYNDAGGKICPACTKSLDETYIKVRKYIYQNPENAEFIDVLEATEVSEKELNYLIKKGRVQVANKVGNGGKCRACGKATSSGSVCEQCMSKLFAEKLRSKDAKKKEVPDQPDKKGIIPMSYYEKL